MKKLLLLGAAALTLSMGVANAADKDFAGFYLGGQGEYGRLTTDTDKDTGFGGSVFGGYGIQNDAWYVGGEVSLGYSGVEAPSSIGTMERGFTYGGAVKAGYEVTPGVLGYGLLGLDAATTKVASAGVDETDYGVRYGVGVEAFVKDNFTVRSEVSYTDWKGKGALEASDEIRATVGVGYHF